MELRWHIEQVNNIAVVRCSGRLVRSTALDDFQNRLERLDTARILVLDLCNVEQVDAGVETPLVDDGVTGIACREQHLEPWPAPHRFAYEGGASIGNRATVEQF